MEKEVRRGYVPTDERDFNEESLIILRKAQTELLYLINRGYPIKSASTFVGNHYMLTERQRLAIVRATSDHHSIELRKAKQLFGTLEGKSISLDGLNLIITLEVALSGSTIIRCMDGTFRDLAGLRGTYRLIDKTSKAILLIGAELSKLKVREAVFYLDSPVSNTGRLKQRILDLLNPYPIDILVELVHSPDGMLMEREIIVSSDSIILNKCKSWVNLAADIINKELSDFSLVDLSMPLT